MTVLLTGANGFVGSHVAEKLVAQGVDLRLLLRNTSRVAFLEGVQYERVEGDLRHVESLAGAVRGVDTVVHMAGLTMGLAISEAEYQQVNNVGTAMLVQAAREAGVRRFVYVSSQAAQGPSQQPVPAIPALPRPVSAYGRSKLAGEYAVLSARDAMSVAIVRPPVVYGQRDRALLPFYRMARLGLVPVCGDGNNLLTWVHVLDAADAVVATARAEGPSGTVYTLSDGAIHTWRSLVETYAKVLGRKVRVLPAPRALFTIAGQAGGLVQALLRRPLPLTPDQVRHMQARYWVCDHEAITRDLGWKPAIGIEEGFAQSLRWYRQHGWL
jgi:nucleoside-diphosphate-sugar epimerase